MKNLNCIIIGAGGVTSYLIPVLLRSFTGTIHIMDADRLEERNLDRQLFGAEHIGITKSLALMTRDATRIRAYNAFLSENNFNFLGEAIASVDVILCCADNHEARKNVLAMSDKFRIPAIIAGNEYFDNEAFFYLPDWKDSDKDPRVQHPEILTNTAGSPLHCQQEQEYQPQLAIANFCAAGKILSLLWRRFSDKRPATMYHIYEGFWEVTVKEETCQST